MRETSDQELLKICEQENALRLTLAEFYNHRASLADKRRGARQEKAQYELARWLRPVINRVDVWPIYAIYILAIVGPSGLVMLGQARAIWLPTWLAAMFSLITAIVVHYCGWRLRAVETDIRRCYRQDYSRHHGSFCYSIITLSRFNV